MIPACTLVWCPAVLDETKLCHKKPGVALQPRQRSRSAVGCGGEQAVLLTRRWMAQPETSARKLSPQSRGKAVPLSATRPLWVVLRLLQLRKAWDRNPCSGFWGQLWPCNLTSHKANQNFTDTPALSLKAVLKLSSFSYRGTKSDVKAANSVLVFSAPHTAMSNERFSFPADTGQLLLPTTVHGHKESITEEQLWLLAPACPATVHFPVGFVKLSSNKPLPNVALRGNMSLLALFSHSMP